MLHYCGLSHSYLALTGFTMHFNGSLTAKKEFSVWVGYWYKVKLVITRKIEQFFNFILFQHLTLIAKAKLASARTISQLIFCSTSWLICLFLFFAHNWLMYFQLQDAYKCLSWIPRNAMLHIQLHSHSHFFLTEIFKQLKGSQVTVSVCKWHGRRRYWCKEETEIK